MARSLAVDPDRTFQSDRHAAVPGRHHPHLPLATKFRNLAHHIEEAHKARWWAAVQAAEEQEARRLRKRFRSRVAFSISSAKSKRSSVYGSVPLLITLAVRQEPPRPSITLSTGCTLSSPSSWW